MENAVHDLFQCENLTEQEKPVSKIDYRMVFYAAAAFLVGGAAVFGFIDAELSFFLWAASLVLIAGYLMVQSLTIWNQQRKTDLDQAKRILKEGHQAFEVLSQIYHRSLQKKQVVETDEMREFCRQINQEVCSRCYLKTNCWEIYTGRTEQYIKQLFGCAERGEDGYDSDVDRRNGFLCENRLAMSSLTKSMWKQAQTDYKWKKKMENSRESLAAQFRGTAEVFERALNSVGSEEKPKKERVIQNVNIGVSKYAKDGVVCGDSCAGTRISDEEYLFLLSDGMGSGKKAATESLLTINTLYQFLKAGFDADLSLNAMNSILVLKSQDEIFATVDMATLNLTDGVMDFYKAGSAAAFIKRQNKVEVIKKGSLPMGIVDKVKVENIEKKLRPKDMILMVSDGIVDADGSSEDNWVEDYLGQIKSSDPQTVADLIMSRAMERYGEGERDDMCALVIAAS